MAHRASAGRAAPPGGVVGYDPDRKPGVSNLLEILAACLGEDVGLTALRFSSYGQLKQAVAESIVDILTPVQERYAQLMDDPAHLTQVRQDGARRVRARAQQTVQRAKQAIGLAAHATALTAG